MFLKMMYPICDCLSLRYLGPCIGHMLMDVIHLLANLSWMGWSAIWNSSEYVVSNMNIYIFNANAYVYHKEW